MRMAQAVALVLDGPAALADERGLTRAAIALAAAVVSEGRALLAVVNKLDAVAPHQRPQVSVLPLRTPCESCTRQNTS